MDREIPFGITIFALAEEEDLLLGMAEDFLKKEPIPLAVCGLHKKGYPLEYQLIQLGASYKKSTKTAPKYKLFQLDSTPVKPGMYYEPEKGKAIEVDIYEIPVSAMGHFMRMVKKPLGIGQIELEDGTLVNGFLCEEYCTRDGKDLTEQGTFSL